MSKKDTSRIYSAAHALGTANAAIQTAQERITELETQNAALRAAKAAPVAPPPAVAPVVEEVAPIPPPAGPPSSLSEALVAAAERYQRAMEAQRARRSGAR
jgi:hypothetical protein